MTPDTPLLVNAPVVGTLRSTHGTAYTGPVVGDGRWTTVLEDKCLCNP